MQTTIKMMPKTRHKHIIISDVSLQRFENAVVDFVIGGGGGGSRLQAVRGILFRNLIYILTNVYTPLSTKTILRKVIELY